MLWGNIMVDRRSLVLQGAVLTLSIAVPSTLASATVAAERRDNCSFLQGVRQELRQLIATGALPANSQKTVRCPLCREQIVVNATEPDETPVVVS
jgi:hypothetical protein